MHAKIATIGVLDTNFQNAQKALSWHLHA